MIIVSREGLPHYRVHGQFTARSERGRTTVTWVWDVYDSQKRRALHITGEEVAVPVGRDPWATLDDRPLAGSRWGALSRSSPSSPRPALWRRASRAANPGGRERRFHPRGVGHFPRFSVGLAEIRGQETGGRGAPGKTFRGARRASGASDSRGRAADRLFRIACQGPVTLFKPARKTCGTRTSSYCQPARPLVIRTPPKARNSRGMAMAGKNGAIKLVAGNSNPRLAEAIARHLATAAHQGGRAALRRHGDLRRDPGERARHRRVRAPVDLVSGQRPPDGAADHHRCAAPRPRRAASRR